MSADTLLKAAALMRERAKGARAGRWVAEAEHVLAEWTDVRHVAECSGSIPEGNEVNAQHIASWHPAVALAVADQLDGMAAVIDEAADGPLAIVAVGLAEKSLAVALAYLGEGA